MATTDILQKMLRNLLIENERYIQDLYRKNVFLFQISRAKISKMYKEERELGTFESKSSRGWPVGNLPKLFA